MAVRVARKVQKALEFVSTFVLRFAGLGMCTVQRNILNLVYTAIYRCNELQDGTTSMAFRQKAR